MSLQVTVAVTGLDEAIVKNQALMATLHEWTEAMTGIGTALTQYYGNAPFVTDGAVFGQTWKALRASTIRGKSNHMKTMVVGGSPGQPLVRSGTMRKSFRFRPTPNSVYIDNAMPYWRYHQTGTGEKGDGAVPGVGRGMNLPQRQTIGLNDTVRGMIQSIIGTAVEAKIKEAIG